MCLMMLLSLEMAACASPYESSESMRERNIERASMALESRLEPDSLAAAALLRQRDPAKTLELLARATIIAPERPDLAWLHIQACGRVPGCDSRAEEGRLGILDPGNGAASLPALALADKADDEAMRRSALSLLARADHLDLYWTTLIVHMTQPVIATGYVSTQEALTEMLGVVSVGATPAFRTVSRSCAGTRLDDPVTLHECRAVALAFERGDTVITQMEGAAIAQRLWPEGSAEWVAANEVRRIQQYRAVQLAHLARSNLADSRAADGFMQICVHNHREEDVVIAELVADGKSPVPPAKWAP